MLKKAEIEQFYRDVDKLDLKFPVAAIGRATGESKGNVSKILGRKLDPSESFLKRFYEKFPKSSTNVSREIEETKPEMANDRLKDDLIALLKKENARLERELTISLKKLRNSQLLIGAMIETNQDLLIELISKLRKTPLGEVAAEVGKRNDDRFQTLKEENNNSYSDK